MAKLRATLRKGVVNSEGLSTVQIAISHHQKTAYISTDIKVEVANFVGGMLVRGKAYQSTNAKIIELLNRYNDRLEHIENIDAKDILQIKEELCAERLEGYHKISKCFEAYIENKKSKGSKVSYITAYKVFCKFCKQNDINIEAIDCTYIEKYNKWLNSVTPFRTETGRNKKHSWTKIEKYREEHPLPKHYSQASISTYLAHLKAVINWCIKEGWVSYKIHPFAKTTIHACDRRENILSAADLNKIKNYTGNNERYIRCRDMFMLSFYTGGANIADMLNFDFSGNEITFERAKVTSRMHGLAKVTIPIIPQAREIAMKYIDETGKLVLGKEKKENLTSEYNYCIKEIADSCEIKSLVTFSSARKAFAQIGTNLGINDNYINYLMGHSMLKARGMLNPYSVMEVKLAGEVLKTIVELSEHPERIEEVFKRNLDNMVKTICR